MTAFNGKGQECWYGSLTGLGIAVPSPKVGTCFVPREAGETTILSGRCQLMGRGGEVVEGCRVPMNGGDDTS